MVALYLLNAGRSPSNLGWDPLGQSFREDLTSFLPYVFAAGGAGLLFSQLFKSLSGKGKRSRPNALVTAAGGVAFGYAIRELTS